MRNIRIFVEFASVVMPGAVLLLMLTLLFAPREWLGSEFASSGVGIAMGLVFSFAAGHLLQGFGQVAIEPIWRRVPMRAAAEWAVNRFTGREKQRYLTNEQIALLEVHYPMKLGIPFPTEGTRDEATLESTLAHAEAYLYSAKVSERLDDLIADYKLNKGLFLAFLLISVALLTSAVGLIEANTGKWTWAAWMASVVAGVSSFMRMDYYSRKYSQTLFLQLLSTMASSREGGGRGEGGGAGGVMPMGMGRGGAGARGQAPPDDDTT